MKREQEIYTQQRRKKRCLRKSCWRKISFKSIHNINVLCIQSVYKLRFVCKPINDFIKISIFKK